jgi:hypothetical protein
MYMYVCMYVVGNGHKKSQIRFAISRNVMHNYFLLISSMTIFRLVTCLERVYSCYYELY